MGVTLQGKNSIRILGKHAKKYTHLHENVLENKE